MKVKLTLWLSQEQIKRFKIACVGFDKGYSEKISELIEEYLKMVDGK